MPETIYDAVKRKLARNKPRLGDLSVLSKEELIEELLIYQAEIEAQNDELYSKHQELTEMSEENRLLFDESPIPYMFLVKGQIKLMNHKAQFTFFPFQHKLKGYFVESLCESGDMSRMLDWMSEKDPARTIELRLRVASGEPRWFLLKLELLGDDGLLLSLTDIDEIKQLQASKTEQERLLLRKAVFESKGETISMLAHQWRQPLGAASSIANSLLVDIELESFDAASFTARLNDLSSVLIDLSKMIQNFHTDFEPETEYRFVTVQALFEKAVGIMASLFESAGIAVEVECDASLQVKVFAGELLQVLLNLLSNACNAIQATRPEQGVIRLKAATHGEGVVIIVEDNGGGVVPGQEMSVFDPYFSTKEDLNGKGLGLYLAKIIVEEHHQGTIRLINDPGTGAAFRLELSDIHRV
jgi:signal transduction histidine kinase/uncharacterized small protein (DUF1192 family)